MRTACMLMDGISAKSSTLAQLGDFEDELRAGFMPVGTVEFVRKAFRILEMDEPPNMSYPDACRPYLLRNVRMMRAGDILGEHFIKPVQTKAFTGFVFNTMNDPEKMDSFTREHYDKYMEMAPDEMVWESEPVEWLSEWRYYVAFGEIVGSARYDQLESNMAPLPDRDIVVRCIQDMNIEHPYVLDFGVLRGGDTALVEANDFWAIGLYENSMSARDYLSLLSARWSSILGQKCIPFERARERNI